MGPVAEPVWLHHWVPENSGSWQCRCPQSLAIWRWHQLQQGGKWWRYGHGVCHQSSQSSNPTCGCQHPSSRVSKGSCDIHSDALRLGRVAIKEHWDQRQSQHVPEVVGVTTRVWCRGGIDRKRNSTINLTTDSGVCFWCLPQTSPLTPDVTTNNFFTVQRGTPKYIWNNHNNYIIPRLTLLIKIFIHTYNHSFTVLSAKSINTVSLPWKLSDFLNTSFSWTLSFPLGPYFSSFFSGDLLVLSYFNSWVSTPPSQLGWSQDAPTWVCRPSSLQHLCFHPPGSTFWSRSRLLPFSSST